MKKIVIIFTALTLFTGCSVQKNQGGQVSSSPNDYSTSTTKVDELTAIKAGNLQDLVIEGLEKRMQIKEGAKEVKIDIISYEGNSIFATIYNDKSKTAEVGVIYAEKLDDEYILQYIDINPIDEKAPFWLVKSSGTMIDGKRNFKINYGYINNDSIDEIRIQYSNSITNSLKVDHRKTFLDVITGQKITEKLVEGRDSDDKVIFSYK